MENAVKTYTTIAIARIAQGTLALSPAQASARAHALKNVGEGLFEITSPVEFKVGETFGYDLDLPRVLASCLEEAAFDKPLEDMDPDELMAFAKGLGLNPAPKTGKKKLIELIKAEEDRQLAEQGKAARIVALEALGDNRSAEETAELEALKA